MSNSLLKQAQETIDMDMTPMIDCVFLLMIFFVLVIDLSQKSLEDLILPKAKYQETDDKPPENRPVFNILQNGAIYYQSKKQFDPNEDGTNYKKILDMLLTVKQQGRNDNTLTFVTENIAGRDVELVDDPILLRADKWTEWHFVGELMKQCSQPQAAFWKVELAMSEQDKELKALEAMRK
jgi:biopolymer transport protein ExbD